jgi:hypothetical protein
MAQLVAVAELPVPATNGTGATVDVSGLEPLRTIVVDGELSGARVIVEYCPTPGPAFFPIAEFESPRNFVTLELPAEEMRVRVDRHTNVAPAVNATVKVAAYTLEPII